MIFLSILQAASDSDITSVGFQIDSTALSYLQDNSIEKIEFYAACNNPNNAYIKHTISMSSNVDTDEVNLGICSESGLNTERLYGLPAFGTVVNAYVTSYNQTVKVSECYLDDDGSTLTVQDCNSDPQTSLTLRFSSEAQEMMADYSANDWSFFWPCTNLYHISTIKSDAMADSIVINDVCSTYNGMVPVFKDKLIGNVKLNTSEPQFESFVSSYDWDNKEATYIYCYTRTHVPTYELYFYACETSMTSKSYSSY